LDLLDLDGPAEPAAPPVQKIPVLAPTTPGQGGKSGFGIQAVLKQENGQLQLLMTCSNSSPVPIGGLAIQVNKNPFGVGPAAALNVADIAPGSTAEVALPMQAGVLSNGQPPTNPVFLQVAIKNSLDVFYFNVPFDLGAILVAGPGLDRDRFSAVWQGVGEGRQTASEGSTATPLTDEVVKQRLAMDNVHYVAKRNVDSSTTHVYIAATTMATNWVIAGEITLRAGSNSVRIAVRTEVAGLVPLFEATICKRLGITK
jgi:AP-1 complex subunit beta-1